MFHGAGRLQKVQQNVKPDLAECANDAPAVRPLLLHMVQISKIHTGKTPKRIHFIPEWAEHRGMKQADVIAELGADKSTVSRWWSGNLPQDKWLEPLARLFRTDIHGLFRPPEDDWLARFFPDRTEEERRRAQSILENAFPKKTG